MNKINENIKKYREINNMSQSDLAKMVNKAVTTVSAWERGVSEPNIATTCLLCDIFDVSLNEMCGYSGRAGDIQELFIKAPVYVQMAILKLLQ